MMRPLFLYLLCFIVSCSGKIKKTKESGNEVKNVPEISIQVHDKFVEFLSREEPSLYKKIDGKFMTTKSGTGEIEPYFFGQDLTDDEFDKAMRIFNKAYKEVSK